MLTTEERHQLITEHLPFANQVARNQKLRSPRCVEFDELQSAAYLGLVDAAGRYDRSKPFLVFASPRIHGEIKDYLRSLYWGGRSLKINVHSIPEEYDYAAEPEPENVDDIFEEMTSGLDPLTKRIIRLRFGEEMNMADIASAVGMSRTRVYQILNKGLRKLRDGLTS